MIKRPEHCDEESVFGLIFRSLLRSLIPAKNVLALTLLTMMMLFSVFFCLFYSLVNDVPCSTCNVYFVVINNFHILFILNLGYSSVTV